MRSPIMALCVVLLMLGSGMISLAQNLDDAEPTGSLQPTRTHVEVLDIWSRPDEQDGDGLYDGIAVLAKIEFNRTGSFSINFKIGPRDGSWWLSGAESFKIDSEGDVANNALPLERNFENFFEGWKLHQQRVNGFLVVQVEVRSATNVLLATLQEISEDYFRYDEFETPTAGAAVTGIGTPVPLDFNDNGLYDILEMPIQVDTTTPGLYRLIMTYKWHWLFEGKTRDRWTTITNETMLHAGTNVVPMWISGGHIMTSKNITVSVYIYKGAFPGSPYWSPPYQVIDGTNYEPPVRDINGGSSSERGVDLDGDGLFDLLRVSVDLEITYPGEYSMTAVILPTGTAIDYSSGSLTDNINRLLAAKRAAKTTGKWTFDEGPDKAVFHFDGRLINAWQHDGTFTVYIYWWGPASFLSWAFGFKTLEFRASDFVHPAPPLELGTTHSDKGVSKSGSKIYDALEVDFNTNVNIPGIYTAFAILYHEGQEIAYARSEGEYDKGLNTIPVRFPGQAIYLSKVTGTFTAVVWIQGAGFDWNDTTLVQPMTVRHVTSEYSWEMFAPPQFQLGPKDPQPVEDLDFILLRTGLMAVRVDRDKPDLTFYMTEDDGTKALLRVIYSRLLAFTDENEDGAPQASEITYTSALWSYDWKMTDVSLVEDPEDGRVASFDLSTVVDLVENDPTATELARPLSTVKEFARVTLTFSMSSRDLNRTDDVGTYLVLGGTELKVDIDIEVLTPVEGIDFLTIEQHLKDDRGNFRPSPDGDEATGDPSDDPKRYQDSAELKQRIEFRERATSAGFYSWVKKAVVTDVNGTEEVTDVLAAYIITDGRMVLYLSYPYDIETASIYHDPSLGIFELDLPFIPEEWKEVFDPLLYGMAAIAAVATVFGLRGRRGRPTEEEDMEWEDDLPEVEVKRPPRPPPADDDIPTLPEDGGATNGSTILPQPPPDLPQMEPRKGDGWVEYAE
jgi:hypothetical protein